MITRLIFRCYFKKLFFVFLLKYLQRILENYHYFSGLDGFFINNIIYLMGLRIDL